MPLDPQIAEILELVKRADRPAFWQLTPQEVREAYRKSAKVLEIPAAKMQRVEDFDIPARDGYPLPLRLYVPQSLQSVKADAMPLLLYFHGGGFTIGSIETHDHVCRMFARDAQCLVISVDYRLAPEARFPVAVDDAWDTLLWVLAHADELGVNPARIALGGDSAGANLAAVTAIGARDLAAQVNHWQPVLQLLIYPRTTLRADTSSQIRCAEGYLLDAKTIAWFFEQYVAPDTPLNDWRLAPLDGAMANGEPVQHAGLAPACILVAGYDPLHDEGVDYACSLEAAGVNVRLFDYSGLVHGFFNFGGYVAAARSAQQDAVNVLKSYFIIQQVGRDY